MNYTILFYDLPLSGRIPVEDFLDQLRKENPKLHAKTFRNIELLSEYGLELGEPFVKYIGDDIYELRSILGSNSTRVFYFYFSKNKNEIVMTNGFLKKTQKTPRQELDKAKQYKKEYKSR